MQAKKIVLTPTSNARTRVNPDSKLGYQSLIATFQFFQEETNIAMRVGADVTLSKGLYYIDWSIEETSQSSTVANAAQYHQPVRTLVEVVAAVNNKWTFAVQGFANGTVNQGTKSPDIGVSVSNAPFADVAIALALSGGANENIIMHPSSLTFGPQDTMKYFKIEVTSDYDISTASQQIITFTGSGTDSAVFAMPGNLTFNIAAPAEDTSAGTITSWNLGTCLITSCSMAPKVSQTGTLWWAMSARQQGASDYTDARCPSLDTIKQYAAELNATTLTEDQQANADKMRDDVDNTETDPADGESWEDF